MAKRVKLKNDMYLDTKYSVHNDTILYDYLDNLDMKVNNLHNSTIVNLWSGSLTSNNTTVNLSDSRRNYDLILVIGNGDTGGKARPTSNLLTNTSIDAAGTNYVVLYVAFTSGNPVLLHFGFPTDTTLKSVSGFNQYFKLTEVWGIKL